MKIKSTVLALMLMGATYAQIQFPQVSSKADIEQVIGYTEVDVEYNRPNVNNRTIFGELVPYGKIWRTGANTNTTIEFNTDVKIDNQILPKGKYAIYTIPNADNWDVIFYKNTENWGNPKDWDDKQIALKTNVQVKKLADKVETFTIGFEDVTVNNAILFLAWDNTKISVKIDAPTKEIAISNIKNQLTDTSSARDFYGAANYYYNQNIDLKQALKWINKALEIDAKAPQHFKDLKLKIEKALK